ncbi:MAG: bifunctional glycosyltransferase family 2/GtrA family protein [Butyrivibrio sp.]|nr:bifunctional glycosyltransferase family 2/GtrA family protein [Butyrivibrio sp.]
MSELIPVIIPAYEPDERLIDLVDELVRTATIPVVVVDDGSDAKKFGKVFDAVKRQDVVILRHAVNMGKGRALKSAFNFCLNEYPDLTGVVTADSDGQHKVDDIKKCMDALRNDKTSLVLGVRNFDKAGIPARSVFGNKLTSRVLKLFTGVSIRDTQTGLRGISADFMRFLLTEKGERFEFETNMLLDARELGIKICEVEIETIYLEENRSSHFNPIKDSIRIYSVFFKFMFSSLSSSLVDIVLFAVLCSALRDVRVPAGYIMVSTIIARVISAVYNFVLNYKVVFKGRGSRLRAAVRYFALAVCIMLLSGFFVDFLHGLLPGVGEVVIKVPVDCLLFLLSFVVQREFVYKE